MRRASICKLFCIVSVFAPILASAVSVRAQAHRYDHMHLAAADQAKAVEWYVKNLGARPGDMPDRVLIGRTIFAFNKRDGSPPSAGGAIDHIGFSYPNIDRK